MSVQTVGNLYFIGLPCNLSVNYAGPPAKIKQLGQSLITD